MQQVTLCSNRLPRVIDCDLIDPENPYPTIHVWYELGDEEYQREISGFAFFHSWLTEKTRGVFSGLRNYWYSIHPDERDEHMAAYITSILEDQPKPETLLCSLQVLFHKLFPSCK